MHVCTGYLGNHWLCAEQAARLQPDLQEHKEFKEMSQYKDAVLPILKFHDKKKMISLATLVIFIMGPLYLERQSLHLNGPRPLNSRQCLKALWSTQRDRLTDNDINSLRPSDAYMHPQPRTSLAQIMACRLFGAKPLSEPMLEYYQLDPWEQTSVKF